MLVDQTAHATGAFSAAGLESEMPAQFAHRQLAFVQRLFYPAAAHRVTNTYIHWCQYLLPE
jgi:hypothetical protein